MIANQNEVGQTLTDTTLEEGYYSPTASLVESARIYLVKCGMNHEQACKLSEEIVEAINLENDADVVSCQRAVIRAASVALEKDTIGLLAIPPAIHSPQHVMMRKAAPYRVIRNLRLSAWLRWPLRRPTYARVNH